VDARRSVAANPPVGEERGAAQGRGVTPARVAVVAALAAAVVALGLILFGGDDGHEYDLLFENGGQLVEGNQVLIGGHPVGSVESLELTDDNLAEVHVSVDQQLHEGTTAAIRATSLSGVANHYVSVSPGPNSNPALEEGSTLGLGYTTTAVDLDQLFNTFPPAVRRGLANFFKGNSEIYAGSGPAANRTFKYFGTGLNRAGAFIRDLNADQRLLERFVVGSSAAATAVARRGNELSDAISNANTAFDAIAAHNESLSASLRLLPQVFRQGNTTFVNLRAALDDIEPLIETAKPATKEFAPFLRELRPVLSKAVPVFQNLRLAVRRPGYANDAAELLGFLPAVQSRASKAFPHSEEAIAAFQPTLNFARAYTPDIFNGFAKVGQVSGYYDANGHYARVQFSNLNLFSYNEVSKELDPIAPSEQYDAFGGSADVKRRCPGGATQPAADGSNPFVEPPFEGASVTPSECDPADVPPGP
jgi:phospholipid/cholesterol/gamma-HCH transport system substrate-binding protein